MGTGSDRVRAGTHHGEAGAVRGISDDRCCLNDFDRRAFVPVLKKEVL
jgi:hypothetical protein